MSTLAEKFARRTIQAALDSTSMTGWQVAPPQYNPRLSRWSMTAFRTDPDDRWGVYGVSELDVLEQMGDLVLTLAEGGTPEAE